MASSIKVQSFTLPASPSGIPTKHQHSFKINSLPTASFQSSFKKHPCELPIQPVPFSLSNASYATFQFVCKLILSCPASLRSSLADSSCFTASQFVTPHKHTAKSSFMQRPLYFRSPVSCSITSVFKSSPSLGMRKRCP